METIEHQSRINADFQALHSIVVPLPYPNPKGSTLEETRRSLPDDIEVECSTDMQYLNQYYYLRQYVYQKDLRVETFSGAEDEIDRRSHLLIARIGHFCIGGLRLTISTKEKPAKLTLERGDFDLHDHIPELRNVNYCDLGRVAILPEYRDSKALHKLFQLAINIAQQHNCKYLFGASPPAAARLFQRTFRHLGYRDELRPDIPMPTGTENKHLHLVFKIIYLQE
jgi:hypothetical protein